MSEARLAEAFDRLDCDDSGYITAEDLIEILGKDVARDEIDVIIAEADSTKDNRVSYSDFLALWENQQELGSDENRKVLESELSSISMDESSSASITDAHAEFLNCWMSSINIETRKFSWLIMQPLSPLESGLVSCFDGSS